TTPPTVTRTPTISPTPNGCGPGSYYFEIESNDTITDAMQLGSMSQAQVLGSIGTIGDLDYYKFQATTGSRVWAYVFTQGASSSAESQLLLLNAAGNIVQ